MKTVKKIVLWCLVIFVLIQFVPVDKVNKPVDQKVNFIETKKTPEKIVTLIKGACYDCHSDETVYPKYASIAPISWSVKSHVNEGRRRMNFSIWETYNKDLKENMLKRSIETLQLKIMPLPGYIVYHDEANLTEAERKLLMDYFEGILESGNY